MKSAISILHITDFHIESWLPPAYELKIEHAAEAALAVIDCEHLFVTVSGDIANAGDAAEYDVASKVFNCLFDTLKSKHDGDIDLILVPGNHDVYKPPEEVPQIRDDKVRMELLAKMEDFFCFASCNEVEWDDKDFSVFDFDLPQSAAFSAVRFCCLNTAPFSTKTFDKGVHVLSCEAFHALRKDSPKELSVVVAHHGPSWLDDSPRLEFEAEALNSIDLLIVGHEHRGGTLIEGQPNKDGLPVFRGGTFSFNDEKECTFTVINVGPLQEGSYNVEEIRFGWDSSNRRFTQYSTCSMSLELKGLAIKPKKEFMRTLPDAISNEESFFSESFSFPRLRSEVALLPEDDALVAKPSAYIESADDFFYQLGNWDCIEISGPVGSGKSSLSRDLYIECTRRGYIPILINPDNASRAFDRTVDALIGEQYGDSQAERAAFKQAPREKKIIIADDFDRIKKKRKNEPELLILQMLKFFGKVIITVPSGYEAVSRALVEGDVREYVACGTFELCACTKQVRDPLVTKRCQAAGLDAKSIGRMIHAVDRAVRGHSGLFELTPAFVTQYVDYFLANRAEMLSQDELPFRQIFDSNIRRDMHKAAYHSQHGKWDSQLIDAAVAALQEIALRMHIQRTAVLSAQEISEVITAYAKEHDLELEPLDVIDIACDAGLLVRLKDGFSCTFSSLYVHAYFVARRIDVGLDLNEAWVEEQIDRVLDEVCFPINEEVVVFLAQMRLSTDFPLRLIERAKQIVGDGIIRDPFDPGIHASFRPLLGVDVSAIDDSRAGSIAVIEDRLEDDGQTMHEALEYKDYYDNDPAQLEAPFVRAVMAVKYVELAAGYLVKHFAKMPAQPKRSIRTALFQIPLNAADIVVSDVDCRFDELVASIAHTLSKETSKNDDDTDLIARRFVASVSLGLVYSFMGTVLAHASENKTTVGYLLNEEGDSFGYRMGKLLALSFGGDSEDFVNAAVSIAKSEQQHRNYIQTILIKIIVNQYLLDNSNISPSYKHRLLHGVFNLPGDSSNAILGLRRQQQSK